MNGNDAALPIAIGDDPGLVRRLTGELAARGIALPPGTLRVGFYGNSAELSEELIGLMARGIKRGTAGLVWSYEHDHETSPEPGDLEIVIDHLERPRLLLRITGSRIVPYSSVDAEHAAIEGEGDGSLEFWRRAHWEFFSWDCGRIGREPSDDMPVVCTTFELIRVIDAAPGTWA